MGYTVTRWLNFLNALSKSCYIFFPMEKPVLRYVHATKINEIHEIWSESVQDEDDNRINFPIQYICRSNTI